ncbi:hypothetical protein CASFOL_016227 [Castilleja foliolosa]|uniref:Rieske domain-containing protein n=1 Tax=Castilleja foliolosa TaxID=1961234 RepID=A0ABD3DJR2_9LAMI
MSSIATAAALSLPISLSRSNKFNSKRCVKGGFRVFAILGDENGLDERKWMTLFDVEDPRSKVPQHINNNNSNNKSKFLDMNEALEVARFDLQYCDWKARQDVLAIMLLHEKVVEVLNPLAREFKSIGTLRKELAVLQEELSQAHNQVHISEARVSTALDKLAYMETLVNDKIVQDRKTTEIDVFLPTPSTSTESLETTRSRKSRKNLNVSGPVQPYHDQLKNFWYPVAFTADLKDDTMVPIDCFEEPWVLFRGKDGKPGCVQNTCAHRACPLHLGSVNEGRIQCPYHGWEYSTDGKCEKMPSTKKLNVKIKALPCFEQEGMIWIWPGNDPPTANVPSLLPPPGFQIHAEIVMELPVEHGLLLDNLLDLAHAPFTHTSTFAKGWSVPRLGEFLDTGIGSARLLGPVSDRHGIPTALHGTIDDRHLEAREIRRAEHKRVFNASSPTSRLFALVETENEAVVQNVARFRPYTQARPFHGALVETFRRKVLNEDLRLVQGQQERMLNGANVWNWPVSYDKLGVRYRQWRDAIEQGSKQLPFTKSP